MYSTIEKPDNRSKKNIHVTPGFCYHESKYSVRVAPDQERVRAALVLRYEVFNLEFGKGLKSSNLQGLDQDQFDQYCHHLIVEEKTTGKVVGTYRLQTWEMAASGIGFYSAAEFELSEIPEPFLRQSVEVGRGCIHKNHRNGRVLYMLWKGLTAYLISKGRTTLIGCSSVFSCSGDEALLLMQHLEEKDYIAKGLMISAKPGYECLPGNNFDHPICVPEIPVLFQKYLDFGAVVCSQPAIDREFGSVDYLLMLHIYQVDRKIYDFFLRDIHPATG